MLRGKKIALVFAGALVLSACADQVKEASETITTDQNRGNRNCFPIE